MEMRGRRIMITGAAGFIGSHLADRLAGENDLLLIDDFSVGSMDNLRQLENRPGVRIVEADVRDRERMTALCEGVEVLFHLAISCLRTSLNRPVLSHDVNAGGTLSACMAAHARGVARFVYVSSSEIYGTAISVPMSEDHPCRPTTVYGASKLAGELYALAYHRTYGMPASVVRPFNTYGPREPHAGSRAEVIPRFILQLAAGEQPVVYGDGRQTRDFTYVEETVEGLVGAAACDALVGDVVNLAYGREVSILEVAELLAELTGRPAGGVKRADPRPGDVRRHFADTAKAHDLFGFAPRIDIREGLERTLAWFESQGIASRAEPRASGLPNW